MIIKKLAVIILAVVAASCVHAGESQTVFDLSLEELLQIKIKSASRLDEPAADTVMPVVLITQDMIRRSGARQLKDLLITYVPGMTFVQDQNEVNVAMRGVYSSSQQKILVLLDGHRINSHIISSANPDHGIGLDKIEQIEVIRGPGSASYGNVALTAVINIVLKSGADIQGGEIALAAGNYGQIKVSANLGESIGDDGDWLAWFYFYQNDGEAVAISPENDYAIAPDSEIQESIVGGFFDNPAYDVGFRARWDDWSLLLNNRRSHYVEPFTSAALTGQAYTYDDYELFNGIGPGAQYTFYHFEISNRHEFSNQWSWTNQISYDESHMEGVFIFDPVIQLFGLAGFYDDVWGIESFANLSQENLDLVFGYQFEHVNSEDSRFPSGTGGEYNDRLFDENNPLLTPGSEDSHALYATFKMPINDRWLANLGLRYDVKERLTLSSEKEFSPRLGVNYQSEDFQLKLSYSESFVAPPYWNRYTALPTFRGSEDLRPEKINSLQVTPSWQFLDDSLSYELNLFYNRHEDFIFRDNSASQNEPVNTNSGKVTTWGNEHQLIYQGQDWQLRMVAFWHAVLESEKFIATDDEIYSIPQFTFNTIIDNNWSDNFSSQLSIRYIGERLSPININLNGTPVVDPFPAQGVDYLVPDNRLDDEVIVDLSLSYQHFIAENSTLSLHLYNAADTTYFEGGTVIHPYQQEGRWYLLQWRKAF